MMNPKWTLLRSALIIVVCLFSFIFLTPGTAEALGLFTPFGGRVIATLPCTCGASTLITVGLPRPGTFLITPASRVYKNYRPIPGRWVLGIAGGFAPCMMAVFIPIPPFVTCAPTGGGGLVIRMGTS